MARSCIRLVAMSALSVAVSASGDRSACGQDPTTVEDFESCEVGGFPGGWSDLALLRDPVPSERTKVVRVSGPDGAATTALQIESLQGTTQGIYRRIEPLPVYTVTADIRVEQDMPRCFDHLSLEVGLAVFDGASDPYWWGMAEAFAAGVWGVYCGLEEQAGIGLQVVPGTWYRVTLAVDTIQSTLSIRVGDPSTGAELGARTFAYGGVAGQRYDTVFLASNQRGGCGATPTARVTVDNVVYSRPACLSPMRVFQGLPDPSTSCGDFDPGDEVSVAISIERVRCSSPGALVIEDVPPEGWAVTEVQDGGILDGDAVRWTVDGEGLQEGDAFRYRVLAPDTESRVSLWRGGTLTEGGAAHAIEGRADLLRNTPFDECGGIACWNLIGPYGRSGGAAPPEEELRRDYLTDGRASELDFVFAPGAAVATDFRGVAASLGLTQDARAWNPGGVPTVFPWNDPDAAIGLDREVFPGVDDAMAYAQCYVVSEWEQEAYLGVSSADSIQILLNEEEVFLRSTSRTGGDACNPQDAYVGPVVLREGENRLLVKAFEGQGTWDFAIRLHDESGAPVTEGLSVHKLPPAGCRVPPARVTRAVETGDSVRLARHPYPAWSEPGATYEVRLDLSDVRANVGECSSAGAFSVREVVPEGWRPTLAEGAAISGREIVWELDASQGLPASLRYTVEAGEERTTVSFAGSIEESAAPTAFRVGGDRDVVYVPAISPRGRSTTVVDANFDDEVGGFCPGGWICNGAGGLAPFRPRVNPGPGHEGRLQMTPERINVASSAFLSEAIDLETSSLVAEFDAFLSKTAADESADGFCFVVLDAALNTPAALGSGGGGLGYAGLFGSFAIEFDVWDNDAASPVDPSGEMNPAAPHVHVALLRDGDVDAHRQTHLDLQPGGCPLSTGSPACTGWPVMVDRTGTGVPIHVEVEYGNGRLTAWLSAPATGGGAEPEFPRTRILDTVVLFPSALGDEEALRSVYVGFTAATGGRSLVQEVDNVSIVTYSALEEPETLLIRGDCNDDVSVDISDAVCILNWLFLGGAAPGCLAAADANGDGGDDISDATYLLNHLFLGGPPVVEPYPECGAGELESDEVLGCDVPPAGCR